MSLTKNQHPPSKKIFSSANYKTCCVFWHFDQVRNPNRSRDIPTQSHVRSSCFLRTAWINPDIKVLIADLKTCRVLWEFEKLSSTIGWGAMQLVRQPKYAWFQPDFQVQYICRPAANMLMVNKYQMLPPVFPLRCANILYHQIICTVISFSCACNIPNLISYIYHIGQCFSTCATVGTGADEKTLWCEWQTPCRRENPVMLLWMCFKHPLCLINLMFFL